MKIAVYGETRMPVLPYGVGGLGRLTHEHATQFNANGHDVTLFGREGSEFEGQVWSDFEVLGRVWTSFDAIFDCSHDHNLSRNIDGPVLNLISDRECDYMPPNAIVSSVYMQSHYPKAKLVPAGVDVSRVNYNKQGGKELVFAGLGISHKQPDVARRVAARSKKTLIETDGTEPFGNLVGNALGLLCPYTIDASPRTPLEAAAAGTPTICLNTDGTRDHVQDGVTGFVCKDEADMVDAVDWLECLNRRAIRQWAEDNHDVKKTVLGVLDLLLAVADGERW